MGRSRYAGNGIDRGGRDHYMTWRDPTAEDFLGPDILDGVTTIQHIVSDGERLDTLAARYYGDVEHWWVIALANRILFPLGLQPGTRLKIPADPRSIISRVQR